MDFEYGGSYIIIKTYPNFPILKHIQINLDEYEFYGYPKHIKIESNNPFINIGFYNNKGKDSIYYQWGALSTHSTFEPKSRMFLFEKEGEKKPWYLLPKEKVLTGLGIFHKGEYYVAIRTFFTRKKKGYITNIETNHIVVE